MLVAVAEGDAMVGERGEVTVLAPAEEPLEAVGNTVLVVLSAPPVEIR